MASKKVSPSDVSKEMLTVSAACVVSERDYARLKAAGFKPVTRWVDTVARSDKPLKTVEALTLLDRKEGRR
jgi:hypothetical protein